MIPQDIAIVLTISGFVLGFVLLVVLGLWERIDNMWISAGIPVLLILGSLASCFWSFNDNYYDVKSGTVIASSFDAAHYTQSTIIMVGKTPVVQPGYYVPDDWAIEVQDLRTGKYGWFHFSSDPSSTYPIGSHYPID